MRIQSLLYATINPPMRALLRSPLHGLASRNLCLLRYQGRRSGRPFETPLSFMREGNLVRMLSSHETRWWLNFLDGPVDVEVEIARETWRGRAEAITEDGERLRNGVRTFLTGHSSSRYFVLDALRCIDYLATREDVDMTRGVGMTGVSASRGTRCVRPS